MDKYLSNDDSSMSRTKRNQDIYNSTDMSELSRFKTNTNVSVISDAPKGIDIEKIKKYLDAKDEEEDEKRRRISLELPKEEEVEVKQFEEKEYDIHAVLEKAKDKRELDYEEDRHRKLNNTQIDILKTIKIKAEAIEEVDDDITGPINELNTQEKTIVDLIQNIKEGSKSAKDDLLFELMGNDEDSIVMAPIDEEITKDNLKDVLMNITQDLENIKLPDTEYTQEINLEKDKLKEIVQEIEVDDEEEYETDEIKGDGSFYTSSVNFNKGDFEDFDDIEKSVKKSSFFTKLGVVFIVLMLVATVVVLLNFFLDLNLF